MIILHRKARAAQELFPLFSLGVTANFQFHTQLIWQPFEKGLHVTKEACASGCFGLRLLYLTVFQKSCMCSVVLFVLLLVSLAVLGASCCYDVLSYLPLCIAAAFFH